MWPASTRALPWKKPARAASLTQPFKEDIPCSTSVAGVDVRISPPVRGQSLVGPAQKSLNEENLIQAYVEPILEHHLERQFIRGIVSGDFDKDGINDVAASSTFGLNLNGIGEIDVLLGNGDGTLQNQKIFPISVVANTATRAMAIGDFNGDGKIDAVTAGDAAFVLLNISQ